MGQQQQLQLRKQALIQQEQNQQQQQQQQPRPRRRRRRLQPQQQEEQQQQSNSKMIDIDLFESSSGSSSLTCDESKCVSMGLSDNGNWDETIGGFTCFANGGQFPMLCADGYLPRIVEDEAPVTTTDGDENHIEGAGPYHYHTCCPPDHDLSQEEDDPVSRQCSDSIVIAEEANMICEDETRPHPRQMKTHSRTGKSSYVCCDSPLIDTDIGDGNITIEGELGLTANFLDETECVPYSTDAYTPATFRNRYGYVYAMACDLPDFPFPKLRESSAIIEDDWNYYECCRTGPASPPFIQDSDFKKSVYPQIAVSAIAVFCSTLLIAALSLPLWMQSQRRRRRYSTTAAVSSSAAAAPSAASDRVTSRRDRSDSGVSVASNDSGDSGIENVTLKGGNISSTRGTSIRDSSIRGSSIIGVGSSHRRRRSSAAMSSHNKARVSVIYNLYLVYLAVPDLILNLYFLGVYGSYADQQFNARFYGYVLHNGIVPSSRYDHTLPQVFEGAFVAACTTANLYLNAIVAHEVYRLLHNCNRMIRCGPPSARRVTRQTAAAYTLAIVTFVIEYFVVRLTVSKSIELNYLGISSSNGKEDDESGMSMAGILFYANMCFMMLVFFFPIGYLAYVCVAIWKNGLMPSATGRMRQLAWYFFRIIVIFLLTWIPGLALTLMGSHIPRSNGSTLVSIGMLVIALQPILSTCLAMTKIDVRNCVINLLALSYWCNNSDQDGGNGLSKGVSRLFGSSQRTTDIASSLSIHQRELVQSPSLDCNDISRASSRRAKGDSRLGSSLASLDDDRLGSSVESLDVSSKV